jgi:hypothetical protein
MPLEVRLLDALPVYGPVATPFPEEWGRLGSQGTVVEFDTDGDRWVGNFGPGIADLDFVASHPTREGAIVVAAGALYEVDVTSRTAAESSLFDIRSAIDVNDPPGWVFDHYTELARFGPDGIIWRSERLSWEGLRDITIEEGRVNGLAWDLDDTWKPFSVDLVTGAAEGGSYSHHFEV